MPFYAYILRSRVPGGFNKDHSEDLDVRLAQRNAGKTKSIKHGIPWELVYSESFETREAAMKREKYFKSAAGRRFIEGLKLS